MFCYADFIAYLGGTEIHLGLIVGAGMIGALAVRVIQGVGIDRYGPQRVWLFSLLLCTVSMLAHLCITRVDGIGIYLVRMLYMTSIAGAFGSSLTYISLRAPQARMAEMIGILGTSGFVGIALGPILGDFLFADGEIGPKEIQRFFLSAAATSFASFVLVALSTRKAVRSELRRRPPVVAVLRRYHPGAILLVGVGIGIAVGLPHTFLRAYARELGIPGIKTFFVVYAIVALLVRICTRRLTDRIGWRPMILWGLAASTVSMLSYLCVSAEWLLAIPAVSAGVAHAFLLPAVLVGCNAAFPTRYRGIATTLMLTMFDIGSLIGQPAVGGIIHGARRLNLPAYPTMFLTVTAVTIVIALVYRHRSRHSICAA
jgi:MFS family permease